VITYTWVKTLRSQITDSEVRIRYSGLSIGAVTDQNDRQAPAPSIRAASRIASGTVVSPA
jgi:hypothetical protein